MPTKSQTSKSTVKTSKKPTKVAAKTAARKTVSKKAVVQAQKNRTVFVAGVVLVAAALIAISAGFSSYHKRADYDVIGQSQAAPGKGVLYLRTQDGSGSAAGSTLSVGLYENSGNEPVNAVQSDLQYPADQLQIVSVKTSSDFPQEAATDTKTPGLIRIARSVNAQSAALKGARPVAMLEFKVIKNDGTPLKVGINTGLSLLVRSTDNQNILQ